MTKKEKPEFGQWFACVTCGTDEASGLSPKQMIDHLQTVHHLGKKGTRQLNMHMDMSDHYITINDWKFGDVKAVQEIVGPRGKGGR